MSVDLPPYFRDSIRAALDAPSLEITEQIQELWSGYGEILRIEVPGKSPSSIVAKHICIPTKTTHPRGWNSDLGHQRKLRSYQVETQWYQN